MEDSVKGGFVSLENIVSDIQLSIGDLERKQWYTMVLQKTLNVIRNLNVHFAPHYEEVPVDIVGDLRQVAYPIDLVKPISIGIYRMGEWFGFTRRPNMSKTATADGEQYDEDIGEGKDIPRRGFRFGARGFNIGYWVEDNKHRRLFVRNYSKDKAILRYRSNGIDCTTKTCIPYQAKDYVMAMVIYELAMNRIPFRHSGAELQLKMAQVDKHAENYATFEYEPHNMEEFMDSQWASFNSTVRRG